MQASEPKNHDVGLRFTVDDRQCVSPCTKNPIPGKANSPSTPPSALIGQPNWWGFSGDEGLANSGQKAESKYDGYTITISCKTQGNDNQYS